MTGLAPVMTREGAVGWRDIPLDGMTCYHRGVEAVLRGGGMSADEIVAEMSGPITTRFHRDGRPQLRMRTATARWMSAPNGGSRWDVVETRLAAGRPILIWPDGYFWPGDPYEGRRHIHHHAVLATGIDGGTLRFLDVDADEAGGFRGEVPVTEQTRRACTRVLDLDLSRPRRPLRPVDVRRTITASARPLGRLARATADLAQWWAAGPTRRLAHAVDLFALGDVQPQVYLFAALCERYGHSDLAALGYQTAATAKKISLLLFALHRYKPIAPYDLCLGDIESLAVRLEAMWRAASPGEGDDDTTHSSAWLWRRLDALSMWHFNSSIGRCPESVTVRAS
ncbi:hypothetical protein KIPE111705_21975 [Kibdelosporangium persicum]|uniref:Butirosin biosynthesis protein H N-terminal domain-containing protein n=1 Tax=Kibdelosporangium persicum TaxID=2698649 RepID=A0ABX2FEW6_9PSEU|nr:hypothetical protein [Kibdelosporangium persicum]NRN69425.1 hypothetical protein [Kibdelosporangium persicum]